MVESDVVVVAADRDVLAPELRVAAGDDAYDVPGRVCGGFDRVPQAQRGGPARRPDGELLQRRAEHLRGSDVRSEEHTSELQSHHDLVCRLLLEKKKKT